MCVHSLDYQVVKMMRQLSITVFLGCSLGVSVITPRSRGCSPRRSSRSRRWSAAPPSRTQPRPPGLACPRPCSEAGLSWKY